MQNKIIVRIRYILTSMGTLFEIADVLGTPAWKIVREVEEGRKGVGGAGS